jgi:hypothetical protein
MGPTAASFSFHHWKKHMNFKNGAPFDWLRTIDGIF